MDTGCFSAQSDWAFVLSEAPRRSALLQFAITRLGRATARGFHLPAIFLAGGVLVAPACPVVHAQNSSNATADAAPSAALPGNLDPSISTSIPALADPKQALLARGVNFELSYIQDTFGNVTGGVQQGATYSSALYMLVEADLAKLADLSGRDFSDQRLSNPGRQPLGQQCLQLFDDQQHSGAALDPTCGAVDRTKTFRRHGVDSHRSVIGRRRVFHE